MKKLMSMLLIISVLAASVSIPASAKIEILSPSASSQKYPKSPSKKTTVSQPDETPAPTSETTPVFTIDDALDYALEHNRNLIALQDTLTANEYNLKSENQSYDSFRKSGMPSSSISTYYVALGYQVESAKYQIRKAKRDIVQNEYNIKTAVRKAFYEYLNKQKKLETAQTNLDNVTERFNQAKVKNAQGTLSELELSQFEINVQNAQNTINSQKRDIEISMMNLKNTIGYPLDKELKISGEFILPEMDTTPPEEALKRSLTNVNMVELKDSYDLAKYNYDVNMNWYSGNQPQYHTAKSNFEAQTQQYEQSLNQNTISVMSAYNNMVSVYETLDYLNKQVEIVRKNADAQKLRYDMGMITAVDYLDTLNQLADTELTVEDTALNAYLASLNYRAAYDCTDTSDTGEKVENSTIEK